MGNSTEQLKPFVNLFAIVTATHMRDKLVEFNVEEQNLQILGFIFGYTFKQP